MSSSGELTTERIGRPRSPIPATDLAHDDDDDDDDDDGDDDDDDDNTDVYHSKYWLILVANRLSK